MGPDDTHGLFQKFHRGTIARESDKDGTGLGLYVVRQLVEAAGGRVTGESEGAGKGSTFRLTLPAQPIDDTAAER
jgi:signal transduction histidine kinase